MIGLLNSGQIDRINTSQCHEFEGRSILQDSVVTTQLGCDPTVFSLDSTDAMGSNVHGFLTYTAAPSSGYFYQITCASLQSTSLTCLGVTIATMHSMLNLQEGQLLPDTVVSTF